MRSLTLLSCLFGLLLLVSSACKSPESATTKTPEPKSPAAAQKSAEPVIDAPKSAATSMPKAMKPGAAGHFGAPFTLSEERTLTSALNEAKDLQGKTIRVKAKVQSVCKKKGCWMVMQTDEAVARTVRVKMKDYGFFVPKDCDGKTAVVEGLLSRKVVTEAMRKHLAEDQGQDPSKVTGDREEFQMMANGIEILGS